MLSFSGEDGENRIYICVVYMYRTNTNCKMVIFILVGV